MALFLYNVARVVFLGYFAALLVSFGLPLLPYLTNSRQLPYLDRLLLAFFLGAASLILIMYALTTLGWLYPATGIAVAVPILILTFPRWRSFCQEGARRARESWSRWHPDRLEKAALGSVTAGLLGVVLVLLFTRCLYPGETTGDCYEHYWPYLRAVVHGHGTASGETWTDYYTTKGSGLNFLAMLLTDDLACQSVPFVFLLTSAALAFSLVRRMTGNDSWALLTALVYLGAFPFSGSGWGGFHSHHVPAIAWMAAMIWLMVMPWCAERMTPRAWGIAWFLIGVGFLVFCPMFMILVLPPMAAYVGLLAAMGRREWARPALATLAGLVGGLAALLFCNYVVTGMVNENPTRVTWALADQERFSRWCSPYLVDCFNEGSDKSLGRFNSLDFSIRNVEYYVNLFRLDNLRGFYPGYVALLLLGVFLLGRWPLLRERLSISWLALFPILALFATTAVVDVVVRIDASLYRNLVCLLFCASVLLALFWKLFFGCFSPVASRRLTALFMVVVTVVTYVDMAYRTPGARAADYWRFAVGRMSMRKALARGDGLWETAVAAKAIIGPDTPLFYFQRDECMLSRMPSYSLPGSGLLLEPSRTGFQKEWHVVAFESADQARRVLEAKGINYFLIDLSTGFFGCVPYSDLFSPDEIADRFEVVESWGDTFLLTWTGRGGQPLPTYFVNLYRFRHRMARLHPHYAPGCFWGLAENMRTIYEANRERYPIVRPPNLPRVAGWQ